MDIMGRSHETTLTAWFAKNAQDPLARAVLYPDFPEQYVYDKQRRIWKDRQRGFGGTIGRVYAVSPREVEKFHLRLLLYHVPGAQSFEDLRTVGGVLLPTFQAAARRLGLLADDEEWDACLTEAATYQMLAALRRLFATLLLFCSPASPYELWLRHRGSMTEDFVRTARQHQQDPQWQPPSEEMDALGLLSINDHLATHSRSLTEFEGFVLPEDRRRSQADVARSRLMQDQLALSARAAAQPEPSLRFNDDQRAVIDSVQRAMREPADVPKLFFVGGPGGTGKTYLFNALLTSVRRTGDIALAVASSGTAALLLEGGRTAHSLFKVPLSVDETSLCSFTPRSEIPQLLRSTKLIIWDEASMVSRMVFETVSRSFQDVLKMDDPRLADVPFGGKLMVFGGDFRQVLPVVPRGSRAQVVGQSLTRSVLWPFTRILRLRTNMRVQQAQTQAQDPAVLRDFADYLLRIGDGREPTIANGMVQLPPQMHYGKKVQ